MKYHFPKNAGNLNLYYVFMKYLKFIIIYKIKYITRV